MELKKILVGLEGIKAKGSVDLEIKGIEKNSRDLETDFSFITNSFLASIKKEKSHG